MSSALSGVLKKKPAERMTIILVSSNLITANTQLLTSNMNGLLKVTFSLVQTVKYMLTDKTVGL